MEDNYLILPKTTDQSLLARYYSLADVFVICSKRENFPTTCVEAQCCGTPVTGFDTGGTKETSILSEKDFVKYGDVEALSVKMHELLSRGNTGIAEKAQESFSRDTMVKQYINLYDEGGTKERVLLLDVNCKDSSTGKIVYDLYNGLRRDDRSASVCYGRGSEINEEDIYKFGLDTETLVHAGLARITGYNGFFSPLSTKRLIDYIDQYKPDLIHLHELHAYFVNIGPLIRYIKEKKIPVVWTFHCEYMYTGKCGHAYECTNYQRNCGNCPAVKDYPKSLAFDRTKYMLRKKKELLGDLDFTIVTPSQWLADRVKTSFLKDRPIKVIHNGIDTNIFHPAETSELRKELQIGENDKVVLALAPNIMSDAKGGKWVLNLAGRPENSNLRFLLVGD